MLFAVLAVSSPLWPLGGSLALWFGPCRGLVGRPGIPWDKRAGWRFLGVVVTGLGALAYGNWAIRATTLVPSSVPARGALFGLVVSLGVIPWVATFKTLDERRTSIARCLSLVGVIASFTVLRALLPAAYTAPVEMQAYEFRVQMWGFAAGFLGGLAIAPLIQLPGVRYFRLRTGAARELGSICMPEIHGDATP